ncbi:MAG: hypothetical protein DK302_001376, partial [Chloroflexi bacterium]
MNQKSIGIIFLGIIIAFVLTGCGDSRPEPET